MTTQAKDIFQPGDILEVRPEFKNTTAQWSWYQWSFKSSRFIVVAHPTVSPEQLHRDGNVYVKMPARTAGMLRPASEYNEEVDFKGECRTLPKRGLQVVIKCGYDPLLYVISKLHRRQKFYMDFKDVLPSW